MVSAEWSGAFGLRVLGALALVALAGFGALGAVPGPFAGLSTEPAGVRGASGAAVDARTAPSGAKERAAARGLQDTGLAQAAGKAGAGPSADATALDEETAPLDAGEFANAVATQNDLTLGELSGLNVDVAGFEPAFDAIAGAVVLRLFARDDVRHVGFDGRRGGQRDAAERDATEFRVRVETLGERFGDGAQAVGVGLEEVLVDVVLGGATVGEFELPEFDGVGVAEQLDEVVGHYQSWRATRPKGVRSLVGVEEVLDAAVEVVGERERQFQRRVVTVALDGVDGLAGDTDGFRQFALTQLLGLAALADVVVHEYCRSTYQ